MKLRLTPDYRLLTLRDVEADATDGLDQAVGRASADLAGSTGYTLLVSVAQDLMPVDVRLEVLETEPRPASEGEREFDIDFPTAGRRVLRRPRRAAAAESTIRAQD
ncbi:hypothetical protein [Dactylosporangium sp. CA-233914]|uniref:hypothetical protein n=1 Tax=Dactylosporangium sp. CA-233914 TaxID=3239934 RepID=UPI003D8B2C73